MDQHKQLVAIPPSVETAARQMTTDAYASCETATSPTAEANVQGSQEKHRAVQESDEGSRASLRRLCEAGRNGAQAHRGRFGQPDWFWSPSPLGRDKEPKGRGRVRGAANLTQQANARHSGGVPGSRLRTTQLKRTFSAQPFGRNSPSLRRGKLDQRKDGQQGITPFYWNFRSSVGKMELSALAVTGHLANRRSAPRVAADLLSSVPSQMPLSAVTVIRPTPRFSPAIHQWIGRLVSAASVMVHLCTNARGYRASTLAAFGRRAWRPAAPTATRSPNASTCHAGG
jgi:hypothetical protein